ncbi:hypothetical protein OLM64_20805 [Pseudomonas aeruginosa]|uniref:hypothetical protein n=1 Tax=Pseudomonas aeruginosa TaxID=287 RepID=UPI000FFF4BA8|nr:hypothetical protein [Pseudomonas aeruginosa]MBA5079723.1 hypothetical protein [Pseudomonas aeruginosa]MCO3636956.1 hypothetical protein [Pseudomonas aeruginosa]MDI2267348.1 hypothetical protein [Pseudomonas aeruginosa]MDI2279007.1 hypothetical protein [Pseudomonas aeruginosa]MDI2291543.1 hypothetical protein [Pseudomonas aeruginosa]
MLSSGIGLGIELVSPNNVSACSVAGELFRIAGCILHVKDCGEKLLRMESANGSFISIPRKLATNIQIYAARVDWLDEVFAKNIQAALSLCQGGSNVKLLRGIDVAFTSTPPLSLKEFRRNRRVFETEAGLYAFIAGMCGVGMHTAGEISRVGLCAARKPINDWWTQMLAAQELCAQLRDFVVTYRSWRPEGQRISELIKASSFELNEIVWCFRAKAELGGLEN